MPTTLPLATQAVHPQPNRLRSRIAAVIAGALLGFAPSALAQVNGLGAQPLAAGALTASRRLCPPAR